MTSLCIAQLALPAAPATQQHFSVTLSIVCLKVCVVVPLAIAGRALQCNESKSLSAGGDSDANPLSVCFPSWVIRLGTCLGPRHSLRSVPLLPVAVDNSRPWGRQVESPLCGVVSEQVSASMECGFCSDLLSHVLCSSESNVVKALFSLCSSLLAQQQ